MTLPDVGSMAAEPGAGPGPGTDEVTAPVQDTDTAQLSAEAAAVADRVAAELDTVERSLSEQGG